MGKTVNSFAKLFGEGDNQVLIVIRPDPSITMTVRVFGDGVVDSTFDYEDTDEGHTQCRERFESIGEQEAMEWASKLRSGFSELAL